jgi:hypothetical protein
VAEDARGGAPMGRPPKPARPGDVRPVTDPATPARAGDLAPGLGPVSLPTVIRTVDLRGLVEPAAGGGRGGSTTGWAEAVACTPATESSNTLGCPLPLPTAPEAAPVPLPLLLDFSSTSTSRGMPLGAPRPTPAPMLTRDTPDLERNTAGGSTKVPPPPPLPLPWLLLQTPLPPEGTRGDPRRRV